MLAPLPQDGNQPDYPPKLQLLKAVAHMGAGNGKRLGDLLHQALHRRYGDAAAALRRADGKDTGRVHLTENGCEIIADLPKKTAWHQAKLADAVATVRAWGEDPADYVATEMSVPETRFNAWPPRIRALFEPARTVAAGRPSYTLRSIHP